MDGKFDVVPTLRSKIFNLDQDTLGRDHQNAFSFGGTPKKFYCPFIEPNDCVHRCSEVHFLNPRSKKRVHQYFPNLNFKKYLIRSFGYASHLSNPVLTFFHPLYITSIMCRAVFFVHSAFRMMLVPASIVYCSILKHSSEIIALFKKSAASSSSMASGAE